MSRKKIELRVSSLTNSRMQAGAYALILNEVNGNRTLPIIIGMTEAQAIALELRGITPPRPLTHTLFASVLDALGVRLLRVLIYKAEKGIFYAYLYLRTDEMILRVDSRTSDAVVLALHMGVPIYIYEDVLDTVCLPPRNNEQMEGDGKLTQEQSVEALQEALQKAIETEDYEHAAQLRDQINQLKTP